MGPVRLASIFARTLYASSQNLRAKSPIAWSSMLGNACFWCVARTQTLGSCPQSTVATFDEFTNMIRGQINGRSARCERRSVPAPAPIFRHLSQPGLRRAQYFSVARLFRTALRCNRCIHQEGVQFRHDGRAFADRPANPLD
jgi:hypothetical protein